MLCAEACKDAWSTNNSKGTLYEPFPLDHPTPLLSMSLSHLTIQRCTILASPTDHPMMLQQLRGRWPVVGIHSQAAVQKIESWCGGIGGARRPVSGLGDLEHCGEGIL